MSILAIGDQHFQLNNLIEVEQFIIKLETYAKQVKPDYIILLGDLLHTHEKLHTITLNKASEFINRMRLIATTYVIVGNHDMVSCTQFLTDQHWLNNIKEWSNVVIVDKVTHLCINNIFNIILCPFVPNGRFVEALDTLTTFDWKTANLIFAHQEFFGCKMGMMISESGDKWDISHPYVISGHIHQKQKPQDNIYYTGSPIQHAYGESVNNTIINISIENNSFSFKEIDLELQKKKIVYMDIDSIDEYKNANTKDQIKLTISGNYEQFKTFKKTEKFKELTQTNNVKIVFKQTKSNTPDFACKTNHSNFKEVLASLVIYEKNVDLYKAYELIVNNEIVEDVLILL
jgi:DNA repair exonuclease SbcCD nuclease subunit